MATYGRLHWDTANSLIIWDVLEKCGKIWDGSPQVYQVKALTWFHQQKLGILLTDRKTPHFNPFHTDSLG